MLVVLILIDFIQELRVSNGFGGVVLRYFVGNYISSHYMHGENVSYFCLNMVYLDITCQLVHDFHLLVVRSFSWLVV